MTITENSITSSNVVTVEPSSLPVSLSEMKEHLRVTDDGENNYINDLLSAVTDLAQTAQGRQYVTATREWKLDRFPARSSIPMFVPFAPLQSVTSITYLDDAGDTQTWSVDDYVVDIASEPGRILPEFDTLYPTTRREMQSVTVTFVAGYGSASSVPHKKKALVKMWVAHLFEFREPVVAGAVTKVPDTLQALISEDSLNISI